MPKAIRYQANISKLCVEMKRSSQRTQTQAARKLTMKPTANIGTSAEDSAWRSNELAAEFVHDALGDFRLVRTDAQGGEVMVSRAQADVLLPTHH